MRWRGWNDEDANSTSDLDIRLQQDHDPGRQAGTTPIFLCGGCSGRLIHVLSGTNVNINDVTLKLGKLPSGRAGAGLHRAGQHRDLEPRDDRAHQRRRQRGGVLNQAR
jgi:hypothetical protein